MNSAGRALAFNKANVQGQFLLLYSYEFYCSTSATFTVKLHLWFSMYYGKFLVLFEHFFIINHDKPFVKVDEMCFCMYE